jgi:hypothetical protein
MQSGADMRNRSFSTGSCCSGVNLRNNAIHGSDEPPKTAGLEEPGSGKKV